MRGIGSHPAVRAGIALALTGLALGRAPGARADDGVMDAKRVLYLRYCSACHGPIGQGDGTVGQYMTPRPTDLTQITKKHDNTFPFQGTMKILDGTNNVRAHGTPEAPVWAETWREQSGSSADQRAEIRGKIVLITEYVMSIQDRPPIELKLTPPAKPK